MEFHLPGIFDRLRHVQREKKRQIQAFREAEVAQYTIESSQVMVQMSFPQVRASASVMGSPQQSPLHESSPSVEEVKTGVASPTENMSLDPRPGNEMRTSVVTSPMENTFPDPRPANEIKGVADEKTDVVFHDDSSIRVVSKGDTIFNDKCMAASKVCRQMSRRYFWLTAMVQFLACSSATCSGFVALESFTWGIVLGVLSAFFSVVNFVLGWTALHEKYATLARNFIRLMRSADKDAESRFQEYILFMDSSVLESDFD